MTIFVYDSSFDGFLTAVFEVYERRAHDAKICRNAVQQDVFAVVINVCTDKEKAKRVWTSLQKKLSKTALYSLFCCYLSEMEGIETEMLQYIRYALTSAINIEEDYGNAAVLKINQTEKKTHREKHRMEAFVRFQLIKDDIYYAAISPDYNVLPLIVSHFKSRYADQRWLIYDLKRNYGYHYDSLTGKIAEVVFSDDNVTHKSPVTDILDAHELYYQALWKDYFKSTGIPERKNIKLHIQHVPRRYWQYLTEKQL